MRRGRGGRGRGANPPRRQPPMQPFMSEQLQNINMELELLQQKKQMIETHQRMLQNYKSYNQNQFAPVQQNQFAYDYDAPGPSRPHLYDDNYATGRGPSKKGKKRQMDCWVEDPTPKRFCNTNNAQFAQHPSTLNAPKNRPPQVQDKKAKKKVAKGALTLRPNVEPSPVLQGHMEYGLGVILKQMKDQVADSENLRPVMHRPAYLNNIKAEVRYRIRTQLTNRTIEKQQDVVDIYRQRYPVESDHLLIKKVSREMAAKTSTGDITSNYVVTAPMNPTNFRTKELPIIVDTELDEVFRKLEIIYNPNMTEGQKAARLGRKKAEVNEFEQFVPDAEKTDEIIRWKSEMRAKIRRMVPNVLLDSVNRICNLLKLDLMYVNSCQAVFNNEGLPAGNKPHTHTLEPTTGLPRFCAKVRGHPKLPPTTVMRPFLNQFDPIWVKKKRMVRNMLFVAFKDQASLDKILKKDGFDFGKCFLKITRVMSKKQETSNTNQARSKNVKVKKNIKKRASVNNEPKPHDVSANLTDQINELLSSIRQAEENILAENSEEKTDTEAEKDANEQENTNTNIPSEGTDKNEGQNESQGVNNSTGNDNISDGTTTGTAVIEPQKDSQNVAVEENKQQDTASKTDMAEKQENNESKQGDLTTSDKDKVADKETTADAN